jgi:hypothetical protein
MRLLLTVEETFLVTARGLVLWPAPPIDEVRGPGDVEVELRLPDGSRRVDTLSIRHEFFTPPPAVGRWVCVFKSLDKEQVPIGTEVWCSEQIFLSANSGDAG